MTTWESWIQKIVREQRERAREAAEPVALPNDAGKWVEFNADVSNFEMDNSLTVARASNSPEGKVGGFRL